MQIWKFFAVSCLLATSAAGCTRPQSTEIGQSAGIQRGDGFVVLSTANAGSDGIIRDEIVLKSLSDHVGSPKIIGSPKWLVEYSFSARPVKIAMTTSNGTQAQPIGLPAPAYLIDCKRVSFRMTLRLVDAGNGAPAYQGSAEEQACAQSAAEQEAVFGRLMGELVAGITL